MGKKIEAVTQGRWWHWKVELMRRFWLASAKHNNGKRNSPLNYKHSKRGTSFWLEPSVYERMKSGFRAVPLWLYFDTWRPSALSKQSVGGPGQVVSACRWMSRALCPTILRCSLRVPPTFWHEWCTPECDCVLELLRFHTACVTSPTSLRVFNLDSRIRCLTSTQFHPKEVPPNALMTPHCF